MYIGDSISLQVCLGHAPGLDINLLGLLCKWPVLNFPNKELIPTKPLINPILPYSSGLFGSPSAASGVVILMQQLLAV